MKIPRSGAHIGGGFLNTDNLIPGESYALKVAAGMDCVRVWLQGGAARRSGRVLVLPKHAASGEDPLEVPANRIICTWDEHVAGSMVFKDTDAFQSVAWLPEVGCGVELRGLGSIRWTVIDVDLPNGRLRVETRLFEQQQQRVVEIGDVRPVRRESEPVVEKAIASPESRSSSRMAVSQAPVAVLDEADERKAAALTPAAIAERLIFSPDACEQYRSLEPTCRRGAEANRMRSRIRRHGKVVRRGRPGEYVSLRVSGWFDVVLTESPTEAADDLWVEKLFLAKARQHEKKKPKARRKGRPLDRREPSRRRPRRRKRAQ